MGDFWKPQLRRAKLIHKWMTYESEKDLNVDFGSAGMLRDDKISLHQYLIENAPGKIIGVDVRDSEFTDVVADLDKPLTMFNDNSIQNIFAGEVIEHLKHPFAFLQECFSILKPGGRMIITTPSAEGLQLLLGRESPWHYFIWTEKNFKLLCEEAGFKVHMSEKINIYYNRNLLLRGAGYLIPKIRPTLFFVLEKDENINTN